jgi:SAM-dependent methyltransferase
MTAPLTIDDPAYFARLAEADEAHWWPRGMWRLASLWLDYALRGRRGLRALDLGCGAGQTLHRLASRPEIGDVVGLDSSLAALAHSGPGQDARLVRADARALPFGRDAFDLITCLDVFQHLPPGTEEQAVDEVRRVLRRGGFVLLRANGRGWSPDPGPGRGMAPYRLGDLVRILSGGGLRVTRASYANCLPAMAQELRGRLRAGHGGRVRSHPAGGGLRLEVPHPWINRVMGVVASSEATVAGRWCLPLPFGHSTMALAYKDG